AEVRRDVSALLRAADDLERGHFLERRAEVFVDELAHFGAGEGVHTERLGVVSGEPRVFEVTRDVQDHDQLFVLLGLLGGFRRRVVELDRRAVVAAGGFLLGRRLAGRDPAHGQGGRQADGIAPQSHDVPPTHGPGTRRHHYNVAPRGVDSMSGPKLQPRYSRGREPGRAGPTVIARPRREVRWMTGAMTRGELWEFSVGEYVSEAAGIGDLDPGP